MATVVVAAVGDISLGDHLIALGFGVRSTIEKWGETHVFQHVHPLLQRADIAFGNLEGVISDIGLDRRQPQTATFRGPGEAVNSLRYAGFNVVNVANNHTLQHGAEAFAETLTALQASDIDTVGLVGGRGFWAEPVIKTVRGVTIGILGYSQITENFRRGVPLYAVWDADNVESDIRRLCEVVDFVVVSCHWGVEQVDCPPQSVTRAARDMVEAGADVVLGHHSHIFQGIERYRDGLIFYSLGNFVFDTIWEKSSRKSALLLLTLEKHDEGKRLAYELFPVRINDHYQPVPLSEPESSNFIEHVREIHIRDREDTGYGTVSVTARAEAAEKKLFWRKIAYVLTHLHRLSGRTWKALIFDKILGRYQRGRRRETAAASEGTAPSSGAPKRHSG